MTFLNLSSNSSTICFLCCWRTQDAHQIRVGGFFFEGGILLTYRLSTPQDCGVHCFSCLFCSYCVQLLGVFYVCHLRNIRYHCKVLILRFHNMKLPYDSWQPSDRRWSHLFHCTFRYDYPSQPFIHFSHLVLSFSWQP